MTTYRSQFRGRGAVARSAARGALLLCAVSLAACAVEYTGGGGERRVFGFGDFELTGTADGTEPGQEAAGLALQVRTIGLSVLAGPETGGFALGYLDYRAAVIRDDSLVIGNPMALACYSDPGCQRRDFQAFASMIQRDRGRAEKGGIE